MKKLFLLATAGLFFTSATFACDGHGKGKKKKSKGKKEACCAKKGSETTITCLLYTSPSPRD